MPRLGAIFLARSTAEEGVPDLPQEAVAHEGRMSCLRHPSLAEFALNLEGFPPSATDEQQILDFVRQGFGALALNRLLFLGQVLKTCRSPCATTTVTGLPQAFQDSDSQAFTRTRAVGEDPGVGGRKGRCLPSEHGWQPKWPAGPGLVRGGTAGSQAP